jgi:hypothetical protein
MDQVLFVENLAYSNILYIGDNARDCLKIIEKFTSRLDRIEKRYAGLFTENENHHTATFHLQHHIQYHFEGGIAIFKFKDEEALPAIVRNECFIACQNLVFEQLIMASFPTFPLN